jgi:hypothetical protein
MNQRDVSTSPLATDGDRCDGGVMRSGWLAGAIAAASLCAALIAGCTAATRPLEATVRMEHLAAKMEHLKVIPPETAQAIVRLMSRDGYDCGQVTCVARLQARNDAVRQRLMTLLAAKAPGSMFAGGSE